MFLCVNELCEAKVSTSVRISRGVSVLTAISAAGYRVWSSTQEPRMAFALLADLSAVLGVVSHGAHSSVVKYL